VSGAPAGFKETGAPAPLSAEIGVCSWLDRAFWPDHSHHSANIQYRPSKLITGSRMSTISISQYVPLIAVIAPLYIGVITIIFQHNNVRRQIKSAHTLRLFEMRKFRLEQLTQHMAKFQSYGVTPDLEHSIQREWYESGTLVELMVDPESPKILELENAMYEFLNADTNEKKFKSNAIYISVCRSIINSEMKTIRDNVMKI
jgi:hypothetical protein